MLLQNVIPFLGKGLMMQDGNWSPENTIRGLVGERAAVAAGSYLAAGWVLRRVVGVHLPGMLDEETDDVAVLEKCNKMIEIDATGAVRLVG